LSLVILATPVVDYCVTRDVLTEIKTGRELYFERFLALGVVLTFRTARGVYKFWKKRK